MGFRRYVAKRSIYTVILLFVILVFNFFLFQVLPYQVACPHTNYLTCVELLYVPPPPTRGGNTSALIEHERAEILNAFGFNQSLPVRFWLYLVNMFTGQFGFNLGGVLGGPVAITINQRLPYTVLLLGSSTVAAFAIGIGIGVIASAKRGKLLDVGSLSVLLFINALPTFFLGGVLIVFQILATGTAYVSVGTLTLTKTGFDIVTPLLQALWLPFLTLTLAGLGGVFLTMRATMIDALEEDYVVMARAKGVSERSVLFKHAFRNAVIPIATAFALSIGFILGGAIITETVFGWPGLGQAIVEGVVSGDFPLEQAIFFLISIMVLLANFAVDLAYGFMDPRIKAG